MTLFNYVVTDQVFLRLKNGDKITVDDLHGWAILAPIGFKFTIRNKDTNESIKAEWANGFNWGSYPKIIAIKDTYVIGKKK